MLYREIIAIYSENQMKHVRNAELLAVKAGVTTGC
jgi:hypothetical protein